MPVVHPCSEPGCGTLTMGTLCLEHEQTREARFRSRLTALARRAQLGVPRGGRPLVATIAACFAAIIAIKASGRSALLL